MSHRNNNTNNHDEDDDETLINETTRLILNPASGDATSAPANRQMNIETASSIFSHTNTAASSSVGQNSPHKKTSKGHTTAASKNPLRDSLAVSISRGESHPVISAVMDPAVANTYDFVSPSVLDRQVAMIPAALAAESARHHNNSNNSTGRPGSPVGSVAASVTTTKSKNNVENNNSNNNNNSKDDLSRSGGIYLGNLPPMPVPVTVVEIVAPPVPRQQQQQSGEENDQDRNHHVERNVTASSASHHQNNNHYHHSPRASTTINTEHGGDDYYYQSSDDQTETESQFSEARKNHQRRKKQNKMSRTARLYTSPNIHNPTSNSFGGVVASSPLENGGNTNQQQYGSTSQQNTKGQSRLKYLWELAPAGKVSILEDFELVVDTENVAKSNRPISTLENNNNLAHNLAVLEIAARGGDLVAGVAPEEMDDEAEQIINEYTSSMNAITSPRNDDGDDDGDDDDSDDNNNVNRSSSSKKKNNKKNAKKKKKHHEEEKLDQLRATAIAGNDITSSCLYAAGVTLRAGGILAPVATLLVCIVLYMFRAVYTEICSALPLNGGTYNALLNTTTKNLAALAGVLSLLSYTATAVTSSASAGAYLNYAFDEVPALWVAIGILLIFAVLTLIGISESANTATFLFVVHVCTLFVLVVGGVIWVIRDDFTQLSENLTNTSNAVRIDPVDGMNIASPHGNYATDLFYGFSAALLGVTGFESSSNYIEQQAKGVFAKTLRNMWIIVLLVNPLIVLLTIGVMPLQDAYEAADYSLAKVAEITIGPGMKTFLVFDATFVLAGAVLTSYVGVSGLIKRMSLDAILPHSFLKKNKFRKTYHVAIVSFCVLCCSLRFLVQDMDTLGAVYSIAFLLVMSLFCVANFALKHKRDSLHRDVVAPTWMVATAFLFVVAGVIGNLSKSAQSTVWFLIYFSIFGGVVLISIRRVQLLKGIAMLTGNRVVCITEWCQKEIMALRRRRMAYFSTSPDMAHLNKILQYVEDNEYGRKIFIVYCNEFQTPELDQQFEASCALLDLVYPKATIDFCRVMKPFNPETVDGVSRVLRVQKNFMFIACPQHEKFPRTFSEYGGIRVITH